MGHRYNYTRSYLKRYAKAKGILYRVVRYGEAADKQVRYRLNPLDDV